MTLKADSTLVTSVVPAANIEARCGGARPTLLIMHYTGMSSAAKAIDWLARAESRVSCHYVIADDGAITQMVPERMRAWHAGVSFWRGERDINSHSIGIEIQNPGHEHGYPDFPPRQMASVIALGKDIMKRNRMRIDGVLAHSDVAPDRKIDPGEKFNWSELARHGLGEWVRPSPIRDGDEVFCVGMQGDAIFEAQRLLAAYGYDIAATGELDAASTKVLRAFQLHFRPRRVDGLLDRSTLKTLARLVETAKRMPSTGVA
ncbi:MAG TPA: N-acetylmuramoyl-L-alanine amidase [Hyphomicrobium sp.]|nr:N-acetylmuramoyl-L-alanine amidase [Hyphomicrobium sp.]